MNWDLSLIADQMHSVVTDAEAALRLEQAVYGLDAQDERSFQAMLSAGLAKWHEVTREVHYPSTRGAKLAARQRCDLVLSPKGRPLRLDSKPATLFDPADTCPPEQALWLEVKCAYQFREGGARH